MRPIVLYGFLAGLFFALFASGALACINDREVANSEREFKSQYKSEFHEQPVIESPEPMKNQLVAFGATGLGTVLLIGSAVVTVRRPR